MGALSLSLSLLSPSLSPPPLQELQRYVCRQREREAGAQGAEARQTMVLRYPLPYPQDPSPPPLVPQRPAELQFGNPYSTDTTRGGRNSNFGKPFCHAPLCQDV